MICPFCGKDGNYQDKTRIVYQTDPHDFLDHRRRGIECGHCNKVYETIEKSTGDPYHKRKRIDPAQLELAISNVAKSRDLSNEKKRKMRKKVDEFRELYNAT